MQLRPPPRSAHAENPFWITYSDLLSSLVLIFLILLIAFQAMNTQNNAQLVEANKTIKKQIAETKKTNEELDRRVRENERLVAETKRINIEKQAKALSLLRTRLNELQNKYRNKIDIDTETGQVKIKHEILFTKNSDRLSDQGKEFLNGFMPDWSSLVLVDEFSGNEGIIDQVVIEGHADRQGAADPSKNYLYNMDLTLRRAETVTTYVFSDGCVFAGKDRLRLLVATSGRSNVETAKTLSEVKKRMPDRTEKEQLEETDKLSRSVNIRLTFKNPLLQWDTSR